jgi:hypothetical protein
MNATELSEVNELEVIADSAISQNQRINLSNLEMIPWNFTLPYFQIFPVPDTSNMNHYGYIMGQILPNILSKTPKDLSQELGPLDLGLSEAFKNAFEESAKINAKRIKVGYSELSIKPVEFIFYSEIKSISPLFAKYWKYQKKVFNQTGFPDLNMDFYSFAKTSPNSEQFNLGCGLINILCKAKDFGFYKTEDNNLLTHLVFNK